MSSSSSFVLPSTFPLATTSSSSAPWKKNLLFVYIDDMRPDVRIPYGRKDAVTPNFDAFSLLPQTRVFSHAFANYPMCSPSRTSTLYGRTPLETQVMTNLDELNQDINPSLFKFLQHKGYYTAVGGKVFHSLSGTGNDGDDCFNSTFSPNLQQKANWCTRDKRALLLKFPNTNEVVSPLICITKGDKSVLEDVQVAQGAIQTLHRIAKNKLFPFAMAVGFYKPHFPLHIHQDFFDAAVANDAERDTPPFPREAFPFPNLSYAQDFILPHNRQGDFSMYSLPSPVFREQVRKAYAGGISQSDYCFGLVYDALKTEQLANDTLVVVLGDHGFGLGESNLWAKDSLYDITLRVPLMIHVPWLIPRKEEKHVTRVQALVELMDVYPTVASLLRLKYPKQVDGRDLSKMLMTTQGEKPETGEAFSMVARCGMFITCTKGETKLTAIGFSLRTYRFRYTVWMKSTPHKQVNWDSPSSAILTEELYDHASDESTLFRYPDVSYDVEAENIAPQRREECALLYQRVKARFLNIH